MSWDDLKAAEGFLDRTGLSLPSEAQWEYAGRGGTTTAYSFGNDCNAQSCDSCATADGFMTWCGNADGTPLPVGEKEANPFGLFDMHGNIYEWCEDDFDMGFYAKPEALEPNPVAITGTGEPPVIRGGGWTDIARVCRSAFRHASSRSGRLFNIGFRPVVQLP